MRENKDKKYLEFVRSLPCCLCGNDAEPHHIIGIGMGMMGGKAYDIHSMPLCRECHSMVHREPAIYPQARWMVQTQEQARNAGVL